MEEEKAKPEMRKIKIKTLSGKTFEMTVESNIEIIKLKEQVEKITSIPVDKQRLVCMGKLLKNEDLLNKFITEDNTTIHLMARIEQQQSSPTQQQQPQQPQPQQPQPQQQPQQSSQQQQQPRQNVPPPFFLNMPQMPQMPPFPGNNIFMQSFTTNNGGVGIGGIGAASGPQNATQFVNQVTSMINNAISQANNSQPRQNIQNLPDLEPIEAALNLLPRMQLRRNVRTVGGQMVGFLERFSYMMERVVPALTYFKFLVMGERGMQEEERKNAEEFRTNIVNVIDRMHEALGGAANAIRDYRFVQEQQQQQQQQGDLHDQGAQATQVQGPQNTVTSPLTQMQEEKKIQEPIIEEEMKNQQPIQNLKEPQKNVNQSTTQQSQSNSQPQQKQQDPTQNAAQGQTQTSPHKQAQQQHQESQNPDQQTQTSPQKQAHQQHQESQNNSEWESEDDEYMDLPDQEINIISTHVMPQGESGDMNDDQLFNQESIQNIINGIMNNLNQQGINPGDINFNVDIQSFPMDLQGFPPNTNQQSQSRQQQQPNQQNQQNQQQSPQQQQQQPQQQQQQTQSQPQQQQQIPQMPQMPQIPQMSQMPAGFFNMGMMNFTLKELITQNYQSQLDAGDFSIFETNHSQIRQALKEFIRQKDGNRQTVVNLLTKEFQQIFLPPNNSPEYAEYFFEGFEAETVTAEILHQNIHKLFNIIDKQYTQQEYAAHAFSNTFIQTLKHLIGEIVYEVSEGMNNGFEDFQKAFKLNFKQGIERVVGADLVSMAEGMGLTEMVLKNLKERYEEYAAQLQQAQQIEQNIQTKQKQDEEKLISQIKQQLIKDLPAQEAQIQEELSQEYLSGDINSKQGY